MNQWIKPAPLSVDSPRTARIKLKVFTAPLLFISAFFPITVLLLPIIINANHATKSLREHGKDSIGTVLSKDRFKYKRNERYRISYEFQVSEINKISTIKSSFAATLKEGDLFFIGMKLPIIYNETSRYYSRINIDNEIRSRETIVKEYILIYFFSFLISAPSLLSFYSILSTYRKSSRERRILSVGTAAPATFVKTKAYLIKVGPYVKLTFRFVDERGLSVESSYGPYYLGQVTTADWERQLSNLTVVYDPKDSRKNLLYPARHAELR